MKNLSALSLILFTILPARAQTIHCGTALWMNRNRNAQEFMQKWSAKMAAADIPAARTLETDHFLIHYSLRGANAVKMVAGDEPLIKTVDSLYAALPAGLSGVPADSTVYARLDKLNAPDPVYIRTAAGFFEQARSYYVDHLKMRAPSSHSLSYYYQATPDAAGKYSVDIVDIGTAIPDYRGEELYALTFPSQDGGMLIENDFLFNTTLDGNGIIHGDTVQSQYQGKVVHNYAIDWAMGLKVTIFHEFYHAVQFTYTPNPIAFHVWYETGAVGMEERNAPEVNDYLQYLPAFFSDLPDVSMFDFPGRTSQYGNGIFHLFLTQSWGEDFDVGTWEHLRTNGNNIQAALASDCSEHQTTCPLIYGQFAAQLAFSGRSIKAPFPLFSPDMPLWPAIHYASPDLTAGSSYATGTQKPFTVRAFKYAAAEAAGRVVLSPDSSLVPVLARLGPDSGNAAVSPSTAVSLDTSEPSADHFLILADGSFLNFSQATIKLLASVPSAGLFAYPNPLMKTSSGTDRLLFSRLDHPAAVSVFGEAGVLVRKMDFSPDSLLWSWDLKDSSGKDVYPGIYYYRADQGKLLTFYLGGPQ